MLTRGTDRLRLAWAAIVLFGLAVVGCGGNANNVFTGRVDASAPLGSGQGLMLGVGDASTGRACTPTTCPKAGFTCGKNSDGCGGIIDCGACSGTDFCGGGGYSQCGSTPAWLQDSGVDAAPPCSPKSCSDWGYDCGFAGDGCGNVLDCGGPSACSLPQYCGGGGAQRCGGDATAAPDGASPACTPTTCDALGLDCGYAGDGCGGSLDCGGPSACSAPQYCGGGGPNKCGGNASAAPDGGLVSLCQPASCATLGYTCGYAGDGCGGALDCGGPSACASPAYCGGGGENQCGGSVFVAADGGSVSLCQPTTCAQLGFDCGAAGDGCGNLLQCGSSCPGAEYCGGGGPNKCGGSVYSMPDGAPVNLCQPATCAQLGFDCGYAGDGCGQLLSCGAACPGAEYCGGGGPNKCGGSVYTAADGGMVSLCQPTSCAAQSIACGQIDDGCGDVLQCGSCAPPDTCGGGGAPGQCGHVCTGLCPYQAACDGGATTTITGTVTAAISQYLNPQAPAKVPLPPDPVPNVLVYIPNAALSALPHGYSVGQCPLCGADVSGNPLVSTYTNFDGTFSLANVPTPPAGVQSQIPIVIQLGRWRKEFLIDTPPSCQTTSVGALRMPANQNDGVPPSQTGGVATTNIPLTALSTGSVDALECLLLKMGVDQSEFTADTGSGRIHLYSGGTKPASGLPGASVPNADPETTLMNATNGTYMSYDQILFPCWGAAVPKPAAELADLISYADSGGHFFATHYSYSWLVQNGEFDRVAQWKPDYNNPGGVTWPMNVSTTPPAAPAPLHSGIFYQWLNLVGALSNGNPTGAPPANPKVQISNPRHDANGVASGSIDWIDGADPDHPDAGAYASLVEHFTFNTPVGQSTQCGHAIFSDFHVDNTSSNGKTFPSECPATALTAQERVLEYMLFDLASCVTPPTSVCTPLTCTAQGLQCGVTGDGCGNPLDCGSCAAPLTCGGGGQRGVCGEPDGGVCSPLSCADQQIGCGPAGDGCGGTLECGTCTGGQTCGGAGVPGQCGEPDGGSCAPITCASQGVFCGPAGDGCGGTLECGTCANGQTCGGGGVRGQCGAPDAGACAPLSCGAQNVACGPAGDGCGNLVQCGDCPEGQSCGGGGTRGRCGAPDAGSCAPLTCNEQNIGCGPAGDGCGNLIQCGVCPEGQTCGGGGVPNQCGLPDAGYCTAQTCAQLQVGCGPTGDGCGDLIQCGSCLLPQTCGGGGVYGQCGGGGSCQPTTCAALGFDCGPAGDGCGGLLDCGSCTPPATCGGGGAAGQCGSSGLPK
jgi:hypothetical protein